MERERRTNQAQRVVKTLFSLYVYVAKATAKDRAGTKCLLSTDFHGLNPSCAYISGTEERYSMSF